MASTRISCCHHSFTQLLGSNGGMLRYARSLRNNPTNAERLLWQHLRRRRLAGFRFHRQHSIGPYICDFTCLEAAILVELDGSQHVEQSASVDPLYSFPHSPT